MRIIFCKIAYMKGYCGDVGDVPRMNSRYLIRDFYAKEKYNFLDGDRNCYGYFMSRDNTIHIERIDGVKPEDDKAEDVLVIWVANRNGKNVIVGWYKNATVYRYYREASVFPIEIRWEYCVSAKAENCYLLPEEKRQFEIPSASDSGAGKGMGMAAIWYAESDYAQKELIPQVLEYIENCEQDDDFINRDFTLEKIRQGYLNPESIVWNAKRSKENAMESLSYIDEALNKKPSSRLLMAKGDILVLLSDMEKAERYYKEAFNTEKLLPGIHKKLLSLYIATGQYDKVIDFVKQLEESDLFKSHTGLDKMFLWVWDVLAHIALDDSKASDSLNKIASLNHEDLKDFEQAMYYFDTFGI